MSKFDQIAKRYFEVLDYWLHPVVTTVDTFPPLNWDKRFEEMRLLMLLALKETGDE